jgi:hypothetical protein
MKYHNYQAQAASNSDFSGGADPYADLELQPRDLELPGLRSNVWPYSWKKHLIEFMYANGFVMAYPNLPNEAGYATSRCLEGVHTGSNGQNQRIAPLVEDVDTEDAHVAERPAVRYGLAVEEWPVVDVQMRPTTLRDLSRAGENFLNAVLTTEADDYSRLVERWAVPQCILDRWVSARPRIEEKPKTLMYQPQYGVDNQMVAFTHAAALAQTLGRTLVAPPLLFPSACVNCSGLQWSKYFNTTAIDRSRDHPYPKVRAIVSVEPAPTFGEKTPVEFDVGKRLERVPLFTLSLQSATHWLSCNDETLFFDGLFTNKLPTRHWPQFSEAVVSVYREVSERLGLERPYTCLHLRNGDFAEACRQWQGQKWFETLEAKGFLCDIPAEELPMFANTTGGLVLSRTPIDESLVRRFGWKTSLDVANATRLQAGVRDPAVAAFVEQMLCADADEIVLNMFSTFSRHIARIRKERHGDEHSPRYFRRNAWLDGAASVLRGDEASTGWEDVREDEEIATTIASLQALDFTGQPS